MYFFPNPLFPLLADPASMAHVQDQPSGLAASNTREPSGNCSETRASQEEETQVIGYTPACPRNTFLWCNFVRDGILIHI